MPRGAEKLIGRESELEVLDQALEDEGTHIVEFVAWGGVGKSALAVEWMTRLAVSDWQGIDRYFDWSFYSQGSREQSAVSADTFIAEALAFFGDADPQAGSPHDRGVRLAEFVAEQSTLLILDGVEPLQYGTGPLKGQLKDPALLALLKGLAQRPFSGLCVLTTREELTDLRAFHDKTVSSHTLEHLTDLAGAALLHYTGATRRGAADIAADDAELQVASGEVSGHALTLSLLGSYLKLAHNGDIDRRDRVRFEKADQTTQGGHAFRVVAAYEQLLQAEDAAEKGVDAEQGPRMLAVMHLLGLFDRPAPADCLAVLRCEPAIDGLTDRLVDLEEDDWNIAVTALVELGLLSSDGGRLDAHSAGAGVLRPTAPRGAAPPPGPRVTGGCTNTSARPRRISPTPPSKTSNRSTRPWPTAARRGLQQEALLEVYHGRILRREGRLQHLETRRVRFTDLGAVACFFEEPWSHEFLPRIWEHRQAWLLERSRVPPACLGPADRGTRADADWADNERSSRKRWKDRRRQSQ